MKLGPFTLAVLAAAALAAPLFTSTGRAQTFPVFGVYSLPGGPRGANPRGAFVQARDGSFYATTYAGGANNTGTVFRYAADYSRFIPLHEFSAFGTANNNADGGRPSAALTEGPDGALYGTTAEGGTAGDGTIFRVTPDGQFTTLFSFDNNGARTGRNVVNPLLLGSDGSFYGTAYTGGTAGFGTVFRFTPGASFGVIANLAPGTGANPLGALVEGADGSLYGTTSASAANNAGTVFKVAKNGAGFTVLHVFGATDSTTNTADGSRPYAGLALGPDGALYGTTNEGGTGGYGTVFRVTTDGGRFSVLHNFQLRDGNGRYPQAALIYSRNGTFYGTTSTGGTNGRGTVYRVAPDGQFATVANLDGGYSGDNVVANVIRTREGQLLGLTQAGGDTNQGVIFQVSLEPAFFGGRAELSNGVDYLSLPDGRFFGYYSFLVDEHYLYHFDLGYEYVFDAQDGLNGVYLYDFQSASFFYTNPSFGFPYLYDFSLNTTLYYYPDPNNPGRYNTNGTRYFFNFATGRIITK